MERVLYGIGVAVGHIIYYFFVGIFRLVTFGIFKYQQANPKVMIVTEGLRFEHTLITSGSGWGKTQLLQKLILEDLPAVRWGQRSVVVIDSQGDMIRKITRLKELAPVKAPPPPPAPETAASQTSETPSLKERKPHTALKFILYSLLVFFIQACMLGVMILTAVIVRNYHGTGKDVDTALYLVIIPLGVLAGLLLYKRATFTEIIIGIITFGVLFLLWRQNIRAFHSFLLISGTIIGGLALRKLFDFSNETQSEPPAQEDMRRHSLAERVVIIDPSDIEHPPALNLFDFGLDRAKGYSALERESLVNGAIAMYEFMFGALLGAELTNRQGVIFRYLARLLMVVPGATIYTLMDFLEKPETARPYLSKLDMATQRFLTTQFFTGGFDTTREQILSRLWGVLSNPTLARMFSHTKNKLNLFEAMNNGSLILINTNKELLKQEGCELFGRFMVALLSQATQERAAIPENARTPCFVYIDEAHDYFDETLELLLNTARKYNVGLTLAHQNLAQFHRKLEQTVLASTSTKWAGGNSADDAYQLAKEMNCEVDFIRQLRKERTQAHFAFYARNKTPNAVEMIVPLGLMERQPKMSDSEFKELLEKNRKRVGAPYEKNLLQQAEKAVGETFALEEQRAL